MVNCLKVLVTFVCECYVIFFEVFVEVNTHQVRQLLGKVKQLLRSFYLCKQEFVSFKRNDSDIHHRYKYTFIYIYIYMHTSDLYIHRSPVDNKRKPIIITSLQREFSHAIVTKMYNYNMQS